MTTFPNDLGNYRGKRTPKPAGKALTPNERFARLKAAFELRQRSYRFKHWLGE